MAYEVVMPYHLHMPSYFLETFTEYPILVFPPVSNPLHAFLSFLSRFISRTRRFRPFGYACLSVGLLQSSAADCIVRCSGPYSLLQWTVQSIAADCNNLPFKRPWPTLENGLFFPLFVI